MLKQLQTAFPQIKFQAQHPLAEETYFKLGGPAEVYVELENKEQLIAVINFCQDHDFKFTIFGDGSNVVVADEGISGLVINFKYQDIIDLDKQTADGKSLIKAGAGLKTSLLVRQSVDWGYTGLEPFLGVPGTVGGAIYNNAHYLESLIGQFVHRVEIIAESGQVEWLSAEECQFGYDYSRFQETQEIILSTELALLPGDKQSSEELIKKTTRYRTQTQPLGQPSSGCIFQNVPNNKQLKKKFPQFADRDYLPAGFLIDQAGLKGLQVGQIQVSHKHAAFMINLGGGTTQELKKLINLVKEKVKTKFGVKLQEEVFYLS